MNYNKKFKDDLSQGELGEKVIASYFEKKFSLEDIEFRGKGKEWDFKGRKGDKTIYFEVKTDRYEYFTKRLTYNMFIEISCSGKPSGILSSKACHFVYYYPDFEEFYIIPMDELRLLCAKENIELSTMSGDGGKTEGYLIHRNLWKDRFKVYNIKKDNELWKDNK
jgi:hypothetical protein